MSQELLIEAYESVGEINEFISSCIATGEDIWPVVLETNGSYIIIHFMEVPIWSNDEDEREFDEEKNEYEPLEPFIRKVINEQLELIKKISL